MLTISVEQRTSNKKPAFPSIVRQGNAGVHPEGFEPPTLGSEDRCSIQLSYGCISKNWKLAKSTLIRLQLWLDQQGNINFPQSRSEQDTKFLRFGNSCFKPIILPGHSPLRGTTIVSNRKNLPTRCLSRFFVVFSGVYGL